MKNIGVVVAHSDDESICMGGTIARFVREGKNVHVLIVTDSSYTNYDGEVHRSSEQVAEETQNALDVLGCSYQFLDYPTKKVVYESTLVEKIDRFVDEYKIDTLFTHAPDDSHNDHSAVGRGVISAGRRVNNLFFFEPMFPAKSMTLFQANFFVDISPYIKIKLEALKMHKSQYEKYKDKWLRLALNIAKVRGSEANTKFAEAFCVVKQTLES